MRVTGVRPMTVINPSGAFRQLVLMTLFPTEHFVRRVVAAAASNAVVTTASFNLVPVADRGRLLAAVRATVVDARVVLAGRVGSSGATGTVAFQIVSHAGLGAIHLFRARLPISTGTSTVDPVWLFDLKWSTAKRSYIHLTFSNFLFASFNLADAAQTFVGYVSLYRVGTARG